MGPSSRGTRNVFASLDRADKMMKSLMRPPAVFESMDRAGRFASIGALTKMPTIKALTANHSMASKMYQDPLAERVSEINKLVAGSQSVVRDGHRLDAMLADITKTRQTLVAAAQPSTPSFAVPVILDQAHARMQIRTLEAPQRFADLARTPEALTRSQRVFTDLVSIRTLADCSVASRVVLESTATLAMALTRSSLADWQPPETLRSSFLMEQVMGAASVNLLGAGGAVTRSITEHDERMRRLLGVGALASEIGRWCAVYPGLGPNSWILRDRVTESFLRDRLPTFEPEGRVDEDVFTEEELRQVLWTPSHHDADEHLLDRLEDVVERQLTLLAAFLPIAADPFIGALMQYSRDGHHRVAQGICFTMSEFTRAILSALTEGGNGSGFDQWFAENGTRLKVIQQGRNTPTRAARWYFVALGQYTGSTDTLEPNEDSAVRRLATRVSRLEAIKHNSAFRAGEVPVLVSAVVRDLTVVLDARFLRSL